jgi:hypothetical protein
MRWIESLPWWTKWLFMGGVGLMSAFASTIMPVYWQAFGFCVGIALCLIACVGTAVHLVNTRRQEQGKPKFKVEPTHLIITGLIVTTIGVAGIVAGEIWRSRISQISTIGGTSSALPEIENKAVLPPKSYTQRDINELLDVLHDAFELMSANVSPAYARAESLSQNWKVTISNEGAEKYATKLLELREYVQTTVWPQINEFMHRKHEYYGTELYVAFDIDDQATGFIPAVDSLIKGIQALPENAPSKTIDLLAPQFEQFKKQTEAFGKWVSTSKTRIEYMTKNLRESGTTGYEKK